MTEVEARHGRGSHGWPISGDIEVQEPKPELRDLQLVELSILREFVRVCEAHGLRYYIAYGTLLGAVRHHGFIPWDDDIDVTMPRSDYNRLAELCVTELQPGFRWQSYKTDRHYPHMFGKLLKGDTVLRHAQEEHLPFQQSVYIDVFPMDGAPGTPWAEAAQRAIIRICRARLNKEITRDGRRRRLVQVVRIIPRGFAIAVFEALTRLTATERSARWVCVAGPYGYHRRRFPSDWFGPGAVQTFEDLTVIGPLNWDGYLAQLYGDYMTPPPASDQISNHEVVELRLGAHPNATDDRSQSDLLVLRDLVACPSCRGDLRQEDGRFACVTCGLTFPIEDGIPVFVEPSLFGQDELDHLAGSQAHGHPAKDDRHKAEQAAYFDREALAEFEIERPAGTPSFYRFLLMEKFRRGVEPLGGRLDGWTALVVCGGSGMDAEFLARAGASVVSSDISLGAATRTRERAQRHGIRIVSIVADVEHLPFRDRSIDLVYVHDGLHHLANPEIGLLEMARVADRGMSITEPARAAFTKLAVKFGIALSREESGNLVARLDPTAVETRLQEAGFRVVRSQRYAMYYRHHPGSVFALLSHPWLLAVVTAGWRAANVILGRVGNKVAIVAVRTTEAR
jgi:lipopolysaccharide cholinephosphotransferase